MAAKQDIAPRVQRLAALGAVALLAVATATAFGRVFVGRSSTWTLILAALLSVALAAAFERRSLLLATFVSALALVAVLGVSVFPHTTWFGLPTGETLRAIGEALGRVGHDARVQVAPSQPLRPLLLAAVTAVWTASFSAHALAVRAGSPLLSVLPPVALVGFADTVLEDGARPGYAFLLLVAALLVVFTDGLRRIRQWGPVWSSPGRRRLSSVAGRGARRVGATALIAALAFPGVLPGFRDEALVDFSTNGTEGTRLDPLVAIRSNLVRDQAIPLYRVTSTDAEGARFGSYWRSYALDTFDGNSWTSSDPQGQRGAILSGQTRLEPRDRPPSNAVRRVHQTIELLREQNDTALPMAYPAVGVSVPTTQIRYDQALGTVMVRGSLPGQTRYTVESNVVIPTPGELDRVSPVSPSPRDVYLPPSLPPRIRQIARDWARGATEPDDPYRRILAIMDRFTSPTGPFVYSTNVDYRQDQDALLTFLTKTHRGFCVQYAAAMAVLVRALGYPARVAVGYRTGTPSGSGFVVTTHDAHAWVEVYFPGYGWLPFEPTPRRPNPLAQIQGSYLNPATSIHPSESQTGASSPNDPTTGSSPTIRRCVVAGRPMPGPICNEPVPAPQGRVGGRGIGGTRFEFDRPSDAYGVPLRVVLLVLLAFGLGLLALVPVVKGVVRLRIARRRGPPREMVLAAFRLFDGEAADVGFGRRPGETLSEYRLRLSERVRFSDGHLARLTDAVARAAYAGEPVEAELARDARQNARVAIRDVRREAGLIRRIVGTYRPGI
jgi:transglutaminase-like putative cysteine protease